MTRTIFQNAPVFSPARTPQARWDKIAWKLNTFYQQGGYFREQDIISFEEQRHYYQDMEESRNNCYATACGFLVRGTNMLAPGDLQKMYLDNNNMLVGKHILNDVVELMYDPMAFEQAVQDGLKADGLLTDIPVSDVKEYFPIVGYSYETGFWGDDEISMDCHYLIPYVKNPGEAVPEFKFQGRYANDKTKLEYYDDALSMMNDNFGSDCYKSDLYLVPVSHLGQKIYLTREPEQVKRFQESYQNNKNRKLIADLKKRFSFLI